MLFMFIRAMTRKRARLNFIFVQVCVSGQGKLIFARVYVSGQGKLLFAQLCVAFYLKGITNARLWVAVCLALSLTSF